MDEEWDDIHPYQYTALPSSHSTRILHLNPGVENDPISGVLECIDLRDERQYEALSYQWGNPDQSLISLMDHGLTLKITESLFNALKDIRHANPRDGSRAIWADAICINQKDIEERQQQVNLMGRIYRNATRVITYIGPEADNSSLGIDFAYELMDYWVDRSEEKPDLRLHIKEEMVNLGLPQANDPRWQAFRKLVTRGWASRCWCAQEFVLNKNLLMMCGRKAIKESFLIPSIVQLVFNRLLPEFTLPQTPDDPISLRECLAHFQELRSSVVNRGISFPMLHLLQLCHPLRATDPRDKIYSLLALASDSDALAIEVSYTLPAAELYTKVAALILTKYPSMNILYSNLSTKSLDLPSWVPDWSTWKFGSHGMTNFTWYNASGTTRRDLQVDLPNSLLHVGGSFVQRISHFSETVGADYLKATYPDQKGWLRKQFDLLKQLESYPDGTPLPEVLWRTLICDLTLAGGDPPDRYVAYFNAFQNLDADCPADVLDMAREYRDALRRRLRYRRLCITEKGYFGAVPDTAQLGDWVCMFEGTRSLFVVREKGNDFSLIGTAYIHGLMYGEVFELNGYEKRIITLC